MKNFEYQSPYNQASGMLSPYIVLIVIHTIICVLIVILHLLLTPIGWFVALFFYPLSIVGTHMIAYVFRKELIGVMQTIQKFGIEVNYQHLSELEKSEYVYVIQDVDVTGYCKIGRTKYPKKRLTDFGVKLPFSIELVKVIEVDNSRIRESELHRKFAEKRVRGEWFNLNSDDIDFIKSI